MSKNHAPTAVTLQLKLIKSVATHPFSKLGQVCLGQAHPSEKSLEIRSKYAFHLSPTTLPHEKQRIGMI
jgi:hypothetical protein